MSQARNQREAGSKVAVLATCTISEMKTCDSNFGKIVFIIHIMESIVRNTCIMYAG
jgi:hypothetical protein